MGAVSKYAHMHTLIVGFASTGDNASLDEVCHGGGELLGVQAQIMLVHQVLADGIGDAADAHLDGIAVVDEGCDHFADLILFGSGGNRANAQYSGALTSYSRVTASTGM